jgi:hypothetical protein
VKDRQPAGDTQNDALFAAKAALKVNAAIRRDADRSEVLLQRMIQRLERKDDERAE